MGKTNDMTKGSVMKSILIFATPLFIGNIFQQFYNMVDSVVVGQYVGKHALAAVGACTAAYSFILALIWGFTTGGSIIISQVFGARDKDGVKKAFISSSKIILIVGVAFTAVGFFLSRTILWALGTPADVIDDATLYMQILCIGTLANCIYNGMAAFLRAIGNSMMPLIALIITSIINVALDLLFVLGFGWGVAGVGWATIISQFISGIICVVYVLVKLPEFRFRLSEFTIDKSMRNEIFRLGLPSAFSSAVVTLSAMFLQRAVNGFGTTVMAAFTANNRGEQICMCLGMAIGMATGTFCGQNAGAKEDERVIKGLHAGFIINIIYTSFVTIALVGGAEWIVGWFTNDPEVVEIGAFAMRITGCFSMVLGFVFIFQNFLRSVSDIRPTIWMSFSEIACRGILPFVLGAMFGYAGVWWATPVGWLGSLLIGVLRYKSGKWKGKVKEVEQAA